VLPVSAELSTHGPLPVAGVSDRATAASLTLSVGSDAGVGSWALSAGATALPPPPNSGPTSASARVWILPTIPALTIPSNVTAFDPTINAQTAAVMAHDAVLDLIIESEARRAHDFELAQQGAAADGLKEFTDVINDDVSKGKVVQKTYSFDQASLTLYLPKLTTQAPRLVGVTLHGTATLITRDASGKVTQTTTPYQKSWGVDVAPGGGTHLVIINDYTDLTPA
jgi:hypothetical protein